MIRQRHEMATNTTATTHWTTACNKHPAGSHKAGATLSPSKRTKTPSSTHFANRPPTPDSPHPSSPRPALSGDQIDDLLSAFFSLAKIDPSEAIHGVPPTSFSAPSSPVVSPVNTPSSNERSRSPCPFTARRHRRTKRTK